ncbi:MAG: HAMP domain-containing histidine kinase [Sandaracinus sp.]|nr:HAMP domain-containing histidine kinase [Sandaracinus sp.]MCB9625289.1 HAMP domain-containing histidine kinase [Sandaracinus sp.]
MSPLARRLSLLALAQLAVLALVAVYIATLTMPGPRDRDLSERVDEVVHRLDEGDDTATLGALADALDLELSVWQDGRVAFSSGRHVVRANRGVGPGRHPPPERREPPSDFGERGFARRGEPDGAGPGGVGPSGPGGPGGPGGPRRTLTRTLSDGRVLAARSGRPPPMWLGPLLTLLAGVLVFGVGGVLTARWIVRPLHALTKAAQEVGEGRLDVRTNLVRDDELGHVARAFDEMVARVADRLRAERELLANVSHELRTPLARIRVAVDLASEGDAEAARMALEDIAIDLNELESLVGDILAAARVDARDAVPLPSGPMDAAALVERAVERTRARHASRRIELEAQDDVQVRGDAMLLRRVVENLVDNAHKYSPSPDTPIRVRAFADHDEWVVRVEDEGAGIAPEDLPRVFEPFYRADKSRTRGGVGLGLSLVKRIVEAHEGTVALQSELGVGTTVEVRLPRA